VGNAVKKIVLSLGETNRDKSIGYKFFPISKTRHRDYKKYIDYCVFAKSVNGRIILNKINISL
jgi:hypothetical protein